MDELTLLLPVMALLPVTALLCVGQDRPATALVLRGMLGVVAALVYALLGAADVALTEALVGTLLATAFYAVALHASMVLRLGVPAGTEAETGTEAELEAVLRRWLEQAQLRLELVPLEPGGEPWPAELHGLLEPGGCLRLRTHHLGQRLLALEGAEDWQRLGGTLWLEERR